MPVAGDLKLTMTADAQDAASAKMRIVRAELSQTTAALKESTVASNADMEVEQLLVKAKERKMRALADERRAIVEAARAEAAATSEKQRSIGVTDRIKDGLTGASKATETFSKVMGIAGVIGAVSGAIAGLASLSRSLSTYEQNLEKAREQQQAFNDLLKKVQGDTHKDELESMGAVERKRAEAADQRAKMEEDYLKLQQHREDAERAIVPLLERANEARYSGLAAEKSEKELQGEVRAQFELIARSRKEEEALARRLQVVTAETTPEYWRQVDAVAAVGAAFDRVVSSSSIALAAIDKARDTVGKALDAAATSEKHKAASAGASAAKSAASAAEAEAKAQAEHIRGLERELELARAKDSIERAGIEIGFARRDLDAKRISWREAELTIALKHVEIAQMLDEKRKGDADRVLNLRDEVALSAARNDTERAHIQLEQELARIEREKKAGALSDAAAGLEGQLATSRFRKEQEARERDQAARQIERIGQVSEKTAAGLAMMSGRLAGLAPAVKGGIEYWAQYQKGTIGVGEALAGTVGVMGEATAQGISDKKEAALVEGIFEEFAAIASAASMQWGPAAEHQAAAIGFFALAGKGGGGGGKGGGGSGAGGGGGSSAPAPSTPARAPQDTRTIVLQQFERGIVYGMGAEVAKAGEETAGSLRGTGMQRRRY